MMRHLPRVIAVKVKGKHTSLFRYEDKHPRLTRETARVGWGPAVGKDEGRDGCFDLTLGIHHLDRITHGTFKRDIMHVKLSALGPHTEQTQAQQ